MILLASIMARVLSGLLISILGEINDKKSCFHVWFVGDGRHIPDSRSKES